MTKSYLKRSSGSPNVEAVPAMLPALHAAEKHRRFICANCGNDWMTVLPGIDTCQVCHHKATPDIADWIRSEGAR